MLNTKKLIIVRFLFKLIPSGSFFGIKASLLRWAGASVGKNLEIYSSVKIMGPIDLQIGDNCFIGHETMIFGAYGSKVTIGDNCTISSRVTIFTGTHHFDATGNKVTKEGCYANVSIEDGSAILLGSIILPGVTIGKMSLIAAGSVVNKTIYEYSMAAGNPAIIKKSLRNEK